MPPTRQHDPFTDAPVRPSSRTRIHQQSHAPMSTAHAFASSSAVVAASATGPAARNNLFNSSLSRRRPATQAVNMRFNGRAGIQQNQSSQGTHSDRNTSTMTETTREAETVLGDLSDVDEDSLLGQAGTRIQRQGHGQREAAVSRGNTAALARTHRPTRRGAPGTVPQNRQAYDTEMHLDALNSSDEEEEDEDEEADTGHDAIGMSTMLNPSRGAASRTQRGRGQSQSHSSTTSRRNHRSQEMGHIDTDTPQDIVTRDAKGVFLHEIPEPGGAAEERRSEEERTCDLSMN